jgi:hypothetical protein
MLPAAVSIPFHTEIAWTHQLSEKDDSVAFTWRVWMVAFSACSMPACTAGSDWSMLRKYSAVASPVCMQQQV